MGETEVKALKQQIRKGMDKASIKTLRILHQILEIENEEDWNELPLGVQQGIEEGIKQADKGEVITHEEFMKKNRKWFKK
jgi:predicted transcriptional regulator